MEKAGLLAPGPTYHHLLLPCQGFSSLLCLHTSEPQLGHSPGQERFPVLGGSAQELLLQEAPLPAGSSSQRWEAIAAALTGAPRLPCLSWWHCIVPPGRSAPVLFKAGHSLQMVSDTRQVPGKHPTSSSWGPSCRKGAWAVKPGAPDAV